jgi:NADH-quinone oxidoreductase subunit L
MTAFYSFRLIYLTFYGESRVDHAVEHHVHESPKVMTVPLMILAFFSVTIGWIGMPGAIIPHVNLFGDFLAPLFPHAEHAAAESHGIERWLMLFSVLVALVSIRMAYSLYVKIHRSRTASPPGSGYLQPAPQQV